MFWQGFWLSIQNYSHQLIALLDIKPHSSPLYKPDFVDCLIVYIEFTGSVFILSKTCLSVCWSGLHVPIPDSLLGGGIPIPEQRLCGTLDSVPLFSLLFFCQTMVLPPPPPPLPPTIFNRFPWPVQFVRILFLFFLMPPLPPCLFSWPSPSSSVWSLGVCPAEV